jgi:hypothetical protein
MDVKMKMFLQFKQGMPTNEKLCNDAVQSILENKDKTYIKENFSALIDEVNQQIYANYLSAQSAIGNPLIAEKIASTKEKLFEEFDSFFMSIFQSRKSRAGEAFEHMIRSLFKSLDYPFSEQINIDGAKPDFILPSADYFRQRPLECIIFTAKRTLRERWRQVVTEANKGYGFFLATIDEKISKSQIEQMANHKVYLVVPKKIKESKYSAFYNVLSFEEFFIRHLDPAMLRWNS